MRERYVGEREERVLLLLGTIGKFAIPLNTRGRAPPNVLSSTTFSIQKILDRTMTKSCNFYSNRNRAVNLKDGDVIPQRV